VGRLHAIEEYHLHDRETNDLSGLDLVFCDTVSHPSIQARRIVPYRLISDATAQDISNRIASSVD
jgi:hypothetical protein